MQTYPIFFHDWQGVAIRAEGHWWIAPRQVSDHLGMNWRSQLRKFRSGILAKGVALKAIPSAGGEQQMQTLKLGHFAHWLLGIDPRKVPQEKRTRLVAMQEALLDAIERQLEQMFGLPGMPEAEELLTLPMPPEPLRRMEPGECMAAREEVLSDPVAFQAARMLRLGLAATKVAPVVRRSLYWTRKQARLFRQIGFVPPTWRERKLCEPDLFTVVSDG